MFKKSLIILFLDDDEVANRIVSREMANTDDKITFAGYRVTKHVIYVRTSEEALDYLHNRGEFKNKFIHHKPDIILVDMYLCGTSGMDFIREVKKDEKISEIPIFVMSISHEDFLIKEAYDLKVCGYLFKDELFAGNKANFEKFTHFCNNMFGHKSDTSFFLLTIRKILIWLENEKRLLFKITSRCRRLGNRSDS